MIVAMQNQISKGLSQIRQMFLGLVAIGGADKVQIKGFEGEVLDEVEVMQQVGFASWIPEDVKVVLIPQQGKTAKSIVVATKGGKVVITVAEGETCIYDQHGHSLWLQKDGVHVKGGNLYVDDGDVIARNGDVIDKTSSMQEMRDIYNDHNNGSDTTKPSVRM